MILICGTWCLIEVNWVHQRIADISHDRHNHRWCTLFKPVYFLAISIANAKCLALLIFLAILSQNDLWRIFYRPK